MRILWIGTAEAVWTAATAWQTLEEFGVDVMRLADAAKAKSALESANFEALVVEAEYDKSLALLAEYKKKLKSEGRSLIVVSNTWTKDDFKKHSKTPGGAQRYVRLPVPVEAFLSMLGELAGVSVKELKDYTLQAEVPPPVPSLAASLAASLSLSGGDDAPEISSPVIPKAPPRRAPGGSAGASEDIETIRKYVRLQEEELAIATAAREELTAENMRLTKENQAQAHKVHELGHERDEEKRRAKALEAEKEALAKELADFREETANNERHFQEQIKHLENRSREAIEKYESLKVRVRKDIRKIRANERDLEARLELARKDSATLLSARDQKVLELQRKIDALEFDLDQVQDSRVQAEMEAERYLAKLSRVARALHVAVAMIEEEHTDEQALEDLEPMLGGAAAEELAVSQEAPAAAEAPPPESPPPAQEEQAPAAEAEAAPPATQDLDALASDGDPTRMINLGNPGDSDPNEAAG